MKTMGYVAVLVAMVNVVSLCSFTTHKTAYDDMAVGIHTHVHAQGARCNGTVGCSCPGFAPITNGQVWQQAYCRYCGHSRGVHK